MSSAKTERLINLTMALLASRRYMPKSEIFRRVAGYEGAPDAMERMFERDKDDLRSLGIEIEVASHDPLFEDEVGYRISPEKYRMKSNYSARELGLMAAALAVVDISEVSDEKQNIAQRLSALSVTPVNSEEISLFASSQVEDKLVEITRAVASRSTIKFNYAKPDELQSQEREVNPMGLSTWRGSWYLVGEDLAKSDIRVFRLSRITDEISISKKNSFEIPETFQVRDYLIMLKENEYRVVVKVRNGYGESLLAKYGNSDRFDTPGLDWQESELNFEDINEALLVISRYGSAVIVESPMELRELIKDGFLATVKCHG
ncbi:MAG: helix-turn-helix transcriptional regulator [Actinomycetales bacterium]